MSVNVLGYQFDDSDDSDILTNHWILTERRNGTLAEDVQTAQAAANRQTQQPVSHQQSHNQKL